MHVKAFEERHEKIDIVLSETGPKLLKRKDEHLRV